MRSSKRIQLPPAASGRLDRALADTLGLGRAVVKRAFSLGEVRIGGRRARASDPAGRTAARGEAPLLERPAEHGGAEEEEAAAADGAESARGFSARRNFERGHVCHSPASVPHNGDSVIEAR